MKEERFPHTRKPLHWWRWRVAGREASEPLRRAQQQGCRGQSREISAQRISADQHSPAQDACLLTCQGRCELGAEAQAPEVRSQGEDWGWLHEHSLKGASVPQLSGRESRKKLGAAEEARNHCLVVREERGFRTPPKQAPELSAWTPEMGMRC